METLKEKAIRLANKAIEDSTLLKSLNEETLFKFVMGVAKYDMTLAMKLEELRPFTNASNKVMFWETAGLLMKQEDYV